jgi:hypothetical protein
MKTAGLFPQNRCHCAFNGMEPSAPAKIRMEETVRATGEVGRPANPKYTPTIPNKRKDLRCVASGRAVIGCKYRFFEGVASIQKKSPKPSGLGERLTNLSQP